MTTTTNRFGLTPDQDSVRSYLALNVWGNLHTTGTSAGQQHVALNNMRSARRFRYNGSGSVTVELTEYPGTPENNVAGGPKDANVFARLILCKDIVEAAKWIDAQETEWMDRNNAEA
jgi:hypothetical protein